MKRIGLFLLAVAMVAGFVGCDPGDTLFTPNYSNMDDVYYLTEMKDYNNGVTLVPPDISGAIVLYEWGTYKLEIKAPGYQITRSGTYELAGETDLLNDTVVLDTGERLPIKDDGLKLQFFVRLASENSVVKKYLMFEFTRS